MARAIFDYTKVVLRKVSFDTDLFMKELRKALKKLFPFEIEELRIWLLEYTRNKPELYPCLTVINS